MVQYIWYGMYERYHTIDKVVVVVVDVDRMESEL